MTINCKGQLIDLSTPKVMGILNLTPNSFFDGGKYKNETEILSQVESMLEDGATFIDIGAYSSKPNADEVSESEELKRIVPIVSLILKHFPNTLISVDTFRSEVARICIDNGASMINDITAGSFDEKMMETVAHNQVPFVMMHMRGTPKTMQSLTQYESIVQEMIYYFSEKVAMARRFGIHDLILDPGFGFAKTLNQNYEVLQQLDLFKMLELPILVGVSRKSMIYNELKCTANETLNGTSVINTIALTKGANILRVHDVKEAVEAVALFHKTFQKP